MQIVKYLYQAKFEWADVTNGPIISFLCYATTPEEAEIKAQEIGTSKARDMDYIGVEHLPFGFVLSSCSAPVPATIMMNAELTKE